MGGTETLHLMPNDLPRPPATARLSASTESFHSEGSRFPRPLPRGHASPPGRPSTKPNILLEPLSHRFPDGWAVPPADLVVLGHECAHA